MTYEAVDCPICKRNIGRFHGQDINKEIAMHISQEHKKEYADIGDKIEHINQIKNIIFEKYGIKIGFVNEVYYRKRRFT